MTTTTQAEIRDPDCEDQTYPKELEALNQQEVVYNIIPHPFYPFLLLSSVKGLKGWEREKGERKENPQIAKYQLH